MRTPTDTFKDELAMRERNYRLLIDQAFDKLEHYRASPYVSTHLGHNLSNIASELSEAAARVESTQSAIMWATAFEAKVTQPLVGFVEMVRDETPPNGEPTDDGFLPHAGDVEQLLILQDKAGNLLKKIEED